jgi:hypothetical protein
VTRNAPSAFSRNRRSTSETGTTSTGERSVSPAFETRASIRPAWAIAASIEALIGQIQFQPHVDGQPIEIARIASGCDHAMPAAREFETGGASDPT